MVSVNSHSTSCNAEPGRDSSNEVRSSTEFPFCSIKETTPPTANNKTNRFASLRESRITRLIISGVKFVYVNLVKPIVDFLFSCLRSEKSSKLEQYSHATEELESSGHESEIEVNPKLDSEIRNGVEDRKKNIIDGKESKIETEKIAKVNVEVGGKSFGEEAEKLVAKKEVTAVVGSKRKAPDLPGFRNPVYFDGERFFDSVEEFEEIETVEKCSEDQLKKTDQEDGMIQLDAEKESVPVDEEMLVDGNIDGFDQPAKEATVKEEEKIENNEKATSENEAVSIEMMKSMDERKEKLRSNLKGLKDKIKDLGEFAKQPKIAEEFCKVASLIDDRSALERLDNKGKCELLVVFSKVLEIFHNNEEVEAYSGLWWGGKSVYKKLLAPIREQVTAYNKIVNSVLPNKQKSESEKRKSDYYISLKPEKVLLWRMKPADALPIIKSLSQCLKKVKSDLDAIAGR